MWCYYSTPSYLLKLSGFFSLIWNCRKKPRDSSNLVRKHLWNRKCCFKPQMSESTSLWRLSPKGRKNSYYFLKKYRHGDVDGWTFILTVYSKWLWLLMEFKKFFFLIRHLATREFTHPIPLRYCVFLGWYLPILSKISSGRNSPGWIQVADWSHAFIPGNWTTDLQVALHSPCSQGSSHWGESYAA